MMITLKIAIDIMEKEITCSKTMCGDRDCETCEYYVDSAAVEAAEVKLLDVCKAIAAVIGNEE